MRAGLVALVIGGMVTWAPPTIGLDLVDHGASSTRPLSPGDSISWPIGVTAAAVELAELRIVVHGSASPAMAEALEVSLQGCTDPWKGDHCPSGGFAIAPSWSIARWQDRWASVFRSDGRIPAAVEVLASVGLRADAPEAVQGERASVRIGFSATGLVCAHGCIAEVDPVPAGDDLSSTGVRLFSALCVGLAAVLGGIGLSRLGSSRWR